MIDMQRLCGAGSPHLGSPFSSQIDGAWYDCATDGHGILLVPGKGSLRLDGPSLAPLVAELPAPQYRAQYADLMGWLREDGSRFEPCEACQCGTIKRFQCTGCKGDGRSICWHCESETDCDDCEGHGYWLTCPECDGRGESRRSDTVSELRGVCFNKCLVFDFLSGVHAHEVLLGFGERLGPILVRPVGAKWLAAIMPTSADTETAAAFPRGILEPIQ